MATNSKVYTPLKSTALVCGGDIPKTVHDIGIVMAFVMQKYPDFEICFKQIANDIVTVFRKDDMSSKITQVQSKSCNKELCQFIRTFGISMNGLRSTIPIQRAMLTFYTFMHVIIQKKNITESYKNMLYDENMSLHAYFNQMACLYKALP